MAKKLVRITHLPTETLLAGRALGWGSTSFEGNLYIRAKYMKTDGFRVHFIPGLCAYKFLYVWLNLRVGDETFRNLGWKYWLPNPLFPFIWFRVALPRHHPELLVEEYEAVAAEAA